MLQNPAITSSPSTSPGAHREAPISDVVDELGRLDLIVQAGRKAEEAARPLKKHLVERLKMAPSEARIVDGRQYQAYIEAAQNEREISDMGKLFETVGKSAFLAHCSFPLKKVDELLPDGAATLLQSDRTGPRKFRFVEILRKVSKALKRAA